mmetsp:Transcript_57158/g.121346  ORF Transcript_57158/g.121346 Transcript_57158/m.121346 type:complete len:244 (+) Transcript_57158:62-793(+)
MMPSFSAHLCIMAIIKILTTCWCAQCYSYSFLALFPLCGSLPTSRRNYLAPTPVIASHSRRHFELWFSGRLRRSAHRLDLPCKLIIWNNTRIPFHTIRTQSNRNQPLRRCRCQFYPSRRGRSRRRRRLTWSPMSNTWARIHSIRAQSNRVHYARRCRCQYCLRRREDRSLRRHCCRWRSQCNRRSTFRRRGTRHLSLRNNSFRTCGSRLPSRSRSSSSWKCCRYFRLAWATEVSERMPLALLS